jgi:hypothetical protein
MTRRMSVWTSRWEVPSSRLESVEEGLREKRKPVRRGGPYDRWDLHLSGGLLGAARMRMVCEDGDKGYQYARFEISPRYSVSAVVFICSLASAALAAGLGGAWSVSLILAACGFAVVRAMVRQCGGAMAAVLEALRPQLAEAAASRARVPARAEAARSASDAAGATI